MIIGKFIVLFGCISVLSALQNYYCEICPNHTLCQYKIPGPSATCSSYDKTALLSDEDIKELVNKINERRNFIAMGHSKLLPQAANMKKIRWSAELATSAQRWADQCNPYLLPDKEDDCRDLKNVKVGQNIGSVVGPAPGLNVKSFIEIWYIQLLDYAGTVSYYNQSRDFKTNYFTQLIWAETEIVGCGKVKFYLYETKVMLERLVCNFAPKGNIHGKSVYSIGYPGTQCAVNMATDDDYKGLCSHENAPSFRKLNTRTPSTDSLLRILNLSNDPTSHDIDPIRNNFRPTNLKRNRQRSQIIRHILSTNSYDSLHHMPLKKKNMRKDLIHNLSRGMHDDEYHYQHERGHSHLYHGHQQSTTPKPINHLTTNYFQRNNNHDFRKYDYTTESIYLISSPRYRKYQQQQQCTRTGQARNNCCNYQCTRGHCYCYHATTTCHSETYTNPVIPDNLCPCVNPNPTKVCPPSSTTADSCYTSCQCAVHEETNYKYPSYNNIPNMVRSGNHKINQESSPPKVESDRMFGTKLGIDFKIIDVNHKTTSFYEQVEHEIHPIYNQQDRDYLYDPFESKLRQKRQIEDETSSQPFWKRNELKQKETPELRALKFTTLTNRKSRKTKRNMQSIYRTFTTEPITINKDYSDDDNESRKPEKYLSFDELMYLRKFSDSYQSPNARRNDPTTKKGAATTKATTAAKGTTKAGANNKTKKTKASTTTKTTVSTPEYTANTPFIRKKHCTRKLTCSWTAFTGTAEDGKQLGPIDFGSKTPPGYVEGCTRTSTCTRDFMDRNILVTTRGNTSLDITEQGVEAGEEDEEYCEKRSLKIRRQISEIKDTSPDVDTCQVYTKTMDSNIEVATVSYSFCNRNKKNRIKRHANIIPKSDSRVMSYADLYYLVLNKIITSYENKSNNTNCLCNCTTIYTNISYILFCAVLYLNYYI